MAILRVKDSDGNIIEIPAIQGETGPRGPKGDAPIKGTDYWTEEDKQEIVNDVIAALPNGAAVSY